jgi:hypothetical protein
MSKVKQVQVMLFDEALVGVHLNDRISVPTKRTMTDGGQMLVPCKFARTGSQLYSAKQLGLADENPNKVITVWRDEKAVFDVASMETFRSAPVTLGHPKDDKGTPIAVTADNSKEFQVGALEGMPTRDEDTLGGTLVLTTQQAIDALEEGTQELSAGYTCDIELVDGKYMQTNIRANHIAIVDKGRAGSNCRISDEADELILADEHPEPLRWDFHTDTAYDSSMKCWELVKSNELVAATNVQDSALLTDAKEALTVAEAKIEAQVVLLADAEKVEVELEQTKVSLADAKVAAEEGVIVRCEAIENARLVADMRDLGDKSVSEIHRLVVSDQMPEKNIDGKSDEFVSAMFEILVDASKSETPMGKLLRSQDTAIHDSVKPYVDPVDASRKKMIARQTAGK